MARSAEALVRPELLVWAREDAGLSLEEAARKISVNPDRVAAWESGEARPTIAQLRKAATAYKRPLAVFFLSRPPKKFQAMHDFRRFAGSARQESPELRYAIRNVRYRRQVALDLFELLGIVPQPFLGSATITENPEDVAHRVRSLLGIDIKQQRAWKTHYDAMNAWRAALEKLDVLVFQVSDVDLSEMRGFSIGERSLPAIGLNIKDAVRGRIFTMLHEFSHLMLNQAGLCDLEERALRPSAEQKVEIFCNHVAGASLLPMNYLMRDEIVLRHGTRSEWTDAELDSLSRNYQVSREVALRRLLIAGRTTDHFYESKIEQYQAEYARMEKSEGFAPPHIMALATAGTLFARLVLENYHREKITSSDVSEFLNVRLKHLPRIEASLLRSGALGEIG
jgi:Zn-dependent peptidase ImmA (M78 family)/transcriptional regulator with XRE-family HTH domain